MLNHVLALIGPLLPGLVARCQLIAPNFSLQGPLLPLLVVLNHVLALPGPLLPRLIAQCQLIAPNFSLTGPLLPLLVVLTHVLALPGPLLSGLIAQSQLIAPNSSLRDLHACVLEQQPSFDSLFLWGNEDSLFNILLWYAP